MKVFGNASRFWVNKEEALESSIRQLGSGTALSEENANKIRDVFNKEKNMSDIVTIKIKVGQITANLTIEEAKQLRDQLNQLMGFTIQWPEATPINTSGVVMQNPPMPPSYVGPGL